MKFCKIRKLFLNSYIFEKIEDLILYSGGKIDLGCLLTVVTPDKVKILHVMTLCVSGCVISAVIEATARKFFSHFSSGSIWQNEPFEWK